MATSPELEIVWDGGSLDLMGENDTDYGPVTIEALADGTEWGNPQSVRRALFSALADGSASVKDRDDNRTVTVKLRLTAADSAALAGGEAPLHMLSTMRRVELRWTPPNDFAAPAVFIVVASDLTHQMSDLDENRCVRLYTLTLVCLPHARSAESTLIEALPPFVAAPVAIFTPTNTTGWTGTDMTFAFTSGEVKATSTAAATPPGQPEWLIRYATYVPAGGLVVTADWLAIKGVSVPTLAEFTIGGSVVSRMATGSDGGWTFWEVTGTITSIRFPLYSHADAGNILLSIDSFDQASAPFASARKQSLRTLEVPGSASATGSLTVESRNGVTGLGEVIAYAGPDYDPRLSTGIVTAYTTNPATLSGITLTGITTVTFLRAAATLPPGSYSLWANPSPVFDTPLVETLNWTITVTLVETGGAHIADIASWTTTTPHPGGVLKRMRPFGLVDLPGVDLPAGTPYLVKFVLTADEQFWWDEGLIFHQDGDLTIVDTNANGATRVLFESPTLDHGPRVLRGSGGPMEDVPVSLATEMPTWPGVLRYPPGTVHLYVGTTGVADPSVLGDLTPTWHTHPAA